MPELNVFNAVETSVQWYTYKNTFALPPGVNDNNYQKQCRDGLEIILNSYPFLTEGVMPDWFHVLTVKVNINLFRYAGSLIIIRIEKGYEKKYFK